MKVLKESYTKEEIDMYAKEVIDAYHDLRTSLYTYWTAVENSDKELDAKLAVTELEEFFDDRLAEIVPTTDNSEEDYE